MAPEEHLNPYDPPKAAVPLPHPSRVWAWVIAVAIVLFGSVAGVSLLMFAFAPDFPPFLLLMMPWPGSLAIAWSVRRKLTRRWGT